MILVAVLATGVATVFGLLLFLGASWQRNNNKLIVVLDLDECLVHVNKTGTFLPSSDGIDSFVALLGASNDDKKVKCQVFLRPGWKTLLTHLSKHPHRYEVHIFTASEADYAKPILAELERRIHSLLGNNNPCPLFTHCWFRDSCRVWTFMHYPFTFKDISILHTRYNRQKSMNRTIMVDDDASNFADNPDHGVPIRPWMGNDPWDDSLDKVLLLLKQLETVQDVRPVLKERFGMCTIYQEARMKYPSFVPDQWEYVTNKVQSVQL